MSAGAFELGKYESNSGVVYSVRAQPETKAASFGGANAYPAGEVTAEPSAIVGGSRRAIGVHCRGIRIRFTGAVPTGYLANSVIFIPIFTQAIWDAITRGTEGTYLGSNAVVVGKTAEAIR